MAVSSQKFLPSGKSGSLAVMPAAKLAMIRTPLVATSSEGPAKKTFVNIYKKVTSLTFIFRKSLVLKNKVINRKRKSAEVEESRQREQKLEERTSRKKNKKNDSLLITPPGGNIMNSLARFAGFTLLGYVVDKYSSLFPKLVEFGKILQPAVEIFGGFAKNLVGNTITFIERGYDAYDTVKDFAKKLGGENYERTFSQFSGALNTFLQAALLTGVAGFGGGLLKPKFLGLDAGSAAGGLGAGPLDQQLKRAKQYFSKYSFRTAKETAPIGSARLSNALLRTSLGIGRAKEFPTARALGANRAFALGYTPLKESYTSAKDKAIAKFVQEGATDRTNQALRRAGIGVIDDAPARNVRRNVLREMGFGNFVGPNEPLTPSRRNVIRKLPSYVKPVSSTRILGQSFSSEIARLKKSYMKLGFSNSDLITIANDVEGKSYFERKAAYDILSRKGLSSRVTNVPSLDLPRPVNRTPQGILRQQQIPRAPSIPRPGEGIIPRSLPVQPSRGILGRGAGRIGKRAALRVGGRAAARFVGRIPVIGPLLDFVVSIALGDDPGEAAAGAVGAALGGFIGGAIAGAGTFGLGAILGGAVGGFVGDLVVRSLYQAAKDYFFKPKSYASGGQVSRGGKVQGEVSRSINIKDIETDKKRVPIPVSPQQTVVGKHLQLDFEKLYGKKGLGLIINSSSEAKRMTFLQNVWGALGGAFIDMMLGQKPDTSLAPSIGSVFGALTNERFGQRVSRGLADGLKNSSNNIFRNLLIASGGTAVSSLDDTPSQEYTPPTNIPSAGYKPTSPGRFNVEQYITGDRTHRNYAADHGGGNYHEHVGFKTREDKERAKAALIEAGFKIGSEFRNDSGYHGAGLAVDIPFYPNGPDLGYSDDKKGEEQFSRDIRRILGIDAPTVRPTPESPVSQTPQASLAPNQTDIKTAYNGLNQQTSYEKAVHERNVFLYQQETILA